MLHTLGSNCCIVTGCIGWHVSECSCIKIYNDGSMTLWFWMAHNFPILYLYSLLRHSGSCVYDGRGVAVCNEGGGALWGRAVCGGRNRGDTKKDTGGHSERVLTGLCGEVRTTGGKCREAGYWVKVVPAAGCTAMPRSEDRIRTIRGRYEGAKALRTTFSFWIAR